MKLNKTPELHSFLTTSFSGTDQENDVETTRAFIAGSPSTLQDQVIAQARTLLEDPELPFEEFGSEANRWFGDAEEARTWLGEILSTLKAAQATGDAIVVKDSNGAVLVEGDSVAVIKDLKVKGGSSDLKRGTLIKKIHLIDDPDNIECRVEGSTLVLKTCFLRKA